ncbi:hypothetical protein D3C81_2265200 [compost metagenome]
MKYPSEPMISTPSYSACWASCEQVTKSWICFSMPSSSSSLGLKGLIGAWMAEGATCLGL